jgi:hypothetical protein
MMPSGVSDSLADLAITPELFALRITQQYLSEKGYHQGAGRNA